MGFKTLPTRGEVTDMSQPITPAPLEPPKAVIGQGMYEITEEPDAAKPAKRGFFGYIKEEILGIAPRPKIKKQKKGEELK
jgi:hypothetical protein